MPAIPSPRVLMGPGPSAVSPRVMQALGSPVLGHLDPELFGALDEIQIGLRQVFGTQNAFTIALTGTGMAGMESCMANLVEPGDNVLIGVHGFFGERLVEMANRYGAKVSRVDAEWGQPLDGREMADAASYAGPLKLVACVHAETSTGVRQPLEQIAEIAARNSALFMVDAVTSLGGLPVEVDRIGIDACYSATQKCIGAPSGLAPLTVSDRALEAVASRKTKVSNWYYDWTLLAKYWGPERAYHHTTSSPLLMALREALRGILEEGLEGRFDRHRRISAVLVGGMRDLGSEPLPDEAHRLPTLNCMRVPAGVDEAAVRRRLLEQFGIEIGAGMGALKSKVWRIGTMGDSARERSVTLLLGAIRETLATLPR